MTKVLQNEPDNIELLRLGEASSPLVVSINSYQGNRYFDIRRHYLDKVTKTTKPGPKGISLKEDEFSLIAEFIVSNLANIASAFTDSLKADEMAVRGARREAIARKNLRGSEQCFEVSFDSWPGPNFFTYEKAPNKTILCFNKRNKFVQEIVSAKTPPKEILVSIIGAYINAKSTLDFGRKVNPESVTEFLEVHWGHELR